MKSDIHCILYHFFQEDNIYNLSENWDILQICTVLPLMSSCCLGVCTKHEHPKIFGGTGNEGAFGHITSIGVFPPPLTTSYSFQSTQARV